MWPVCKKEFSQFFSSLTGIIALAVFLLLNGLFLFVFPDTNIFDFGYATLDKFFELSPWILTFLVPAITMRSLADEFKSGTYEILQTKPLSHARLVTGKYWGCLLIVVMALLPTILYAVSVQALASGNAGIDTGGTIGSYIGLFLLAAAFTAIGIFCSSFTSNAVIAFIVSAFACFILYTGFHAISRIPALASGADYYLEILGIDFHYHRISRGVIDSRDLVYFVSVIVFFLFFTQRNLIHRNSRKGKMKKVAFIKYDWLLLALLLVIINILLSYLPLRSDLTAEKRFTLSEPTKKMLKELNGQVNITVFLDGDMPKDFKKLRNSTNEMLKEFKEYGKGNIKFGFQKIAEGLSDTAKRHFKDSIAGLGIRGYNIKAQIKEGEGEEQREVVPGAVVSYKDRVLGVDLLGGQNSDLDEGSINRAEATLEYKFAGTIHKITKDTVPLIGYLTGNGEPLSYNVYDLIERNIKRNYILRIFPIDSFPAIPAFFSAVIIAKPVQKFTDEQKLKIDQYVMHGGKILWMVNQLYAELDSLRRVQTEFIAFDRGLNLDDMLFKYGVRINQDLVQDLTCAKIATVIGSGAGGKPQVQPLQWVYFPLLGNYSNHPIAKNLDYVVAQFPNSIDTVSAPGITKTVLLATSPDSRILSTPAKVSWNSIQTEEDFKKFNSGTVPVAVLLEGKFSSLFNNHLSTAMRDTLNAIQQPFTGKSSTDTRMIVISDGNMALNLVTQKDGPLAMGIPEAYPGFNFKYANSEFVMNCIEYLVDNSGILETRAKDVTLRLLDKKKLEENKTKWQLINIIGPLLLVFAFGILYQFLRKRKYQG